MNVLMGVGGCDLVGDSVKVVRIPSRDICWLVISLRVWCEDELMWCDSVAMVV